MLRKRIILTAGEAIPTKDLRAVYRSEENLNLSAQPYKRVPAPPKPKPPTRLHEDTRPVRKYRPYAYAFDMDARIRSEIVYELTKDLPIQAVEVRMDYHFLVASGYDRHGCKWIVREPVGPTRDVTLAHIRAQIKSFLDTEEDKTTRIMDQVLKGHLTPNEARDMLGIEDTAFQQNFIYNDESLGITMPRLP